MPQIASSSVPGYPDVDLMLDLDLLLRRVDVASNPLNNIPRINPARNALLDPLTGLPVASGGGTGNVAYLAPAPTGNDDTAILQEFFDDMSSEAVAAGVPRWVQLRSEATYLVQGLWHPDHLRIDGQGATLKKTANAVYIPNGMFTSPLSSVIRAKWIKKNGSWYGSSRFMALKNVTLDANNKDYLAVMEYFNVDNLLIQDVTMIAGLWSLNWTTRIIGRNILIINPVILGATRVFQDGLHILQGRDIHVIGGYIESGDDALAWGADPVTNSVYCDDEGLSDFSVTGTSVLGTRGFGAKFYSPAVKPFSAAPNNYTKTGRVSGGVVKFTGVTGQLRNGGWSFSNHANATDTNPDDIKSIKVHGDVIVGTDGTAIWSAVPGTLIGTPTAVSATNPVTVTLANHGQPSGRVVTFVNIPGNGMQNLVGFYQVRNPTTNTFELSDIAYRNNAVLDGSTFSPWTTGQVIWSSSGTGYQVGQDLSIVGGTALEVAVFRVTQVGPNGEVEAVRPILRGNYTTFPDSPASVTGGTGTGCQLFLETTHSGINAIGVQSSGNRFCESEGQLVINDTTAATSARFMAGDYADTQDSRCDIQVPTLPNGGGVIYRQTATAPLSRRNALRLRGKCSATFPSSVAPITLTNSRDTRVSGLIEDIPTNVAAVTFGFSGNDYQSHLLADVTDGVNGSLFQFFQVGYQVGDYVRIEGNVMSNGSSLDGYYTMYQILDATTHRLKDLDGNIIRTQGLTVTTGGTVRLANNTAIVENLRAVKAAGSNSNFLVGAASATPQLRGTGLIVRDCDASGVDNPLSANVTGFPIFSVSNTLGVTAPRVTYRGTTVTHSMLTSDTIFVQPGAAVTINAPTSPRLGAVLNVTIIHPATGAITVTWDAIFRKGADVGAPAANSRGSIRFEYDGTVWVQQGGPLNYFSPT